MQIQMVLKLTKRCLSFETQNSQIGSTPELPWQVEDLLTVVSTVKKFNFKNVGFEPQKLTFAGFFYCFFMCQLRRKFSPSIRFFVHKVVAEIWKLIVTL